MSAQSPSSLHKYGGYIETFQWQLTSYATHSLARCCVVPAYQLEHLFLPSELHTYQSDSAYFDFRNAKRFP
jgi:hypothetical protein